MPPRPKKKPKAAPTPTYPKIAGKVMQGDSALTATKARELLGWTELAEPKKDDPYDLIYNGVKVRLENNLHNRPIYMSRVVLYMQEIRRGRWRLNGETIVLGRMGTVLNGQHRLIALVLCAIEYEDKPDLYVGLWEHEPVMDVFIAVGIAEDDETVNTLDTAKPRSLTDVLYRSHLLSDVSKAADRKKLARIANYAVRRVWKRTGDQDSHSLKRTHSESMDFLLRHPKLMEAVEFIFEEDEEGAISRYCTPGDAAGMLYLMGLLLVTRLLTLTLMFLGMIS